MGAVGDPDHSGPPDSIEAHRREVRAAIVEATASLVQAHGLRAVTMSQIAELANIGRATLYKYFSGVEEILAVWHERQVNAHHDQLIAVRDQRDDPLARLSAVLETYAFIAHERHDSELSALLHQDAHVVHAQEQLSVLIRELVAACVATGQLRDDVPPDELATYCLHALTAAGSLSSEASVQRLVNVTVAGLHRPDA